MKEKKQELEISVLSEQNGKWQHKILERAVTDQLCADAVEAIDQEDQDMN